MKIRKKNYNMKKKKICCICGKEFEGYGNNPYPLKNEGECCDECNTNFVIPARLAKLAEARHESKD